MNYRELRNVECIELQIKGAGDYFFSRPQFADKKIDGVFFDNVSRTGLLLDLYISIYSIEKKPLYINIPLTEFCFDNISNNVGEVIDWNLTKIIYTGSTAFTLYSYFSMEEKTIEKEYFQSLKLKCKNIRINVNTINDNRFRLDNIANSFTADDAAFFQNKKVRMISCSGNHNFLLNLFLKSGYTLNNISNYFLTQSDNRWNRNILPFIMNDYIDLDRSSIVLLRKSTLSDYIDLIFFYE